MIWTPRQVAQAEGIWAKVELEESQIVRHHRYLIQGCKDQMFKVIQNMAYPFGLMLHPDDIRYKLGPVQKMAPLRIMEGHWSPRTRVIELLGGQDDGVQMTVTDKGLFQRFRVPLQPGPIRIEPDETGPVMLEAVAESYDFHGWHEERRIWIYKWSG